MSDGVVLTMIDAVVGGLLAALGLMAVFVVLGQAILIVRRNRMRRTLEGKPRA